MSEHSAARPRVPGTVEAELPNQAVVAERASRDAGGVPATLLDGYLAELAKVSAGQRLSRHELHRQREIGARAVEQGVPMRAVIDLYLSATWIAWPSLPGVRQAGGADAIRRIGEAVFRAADAAIMAVAEGYEEAQRWLLRQEESFRREFVDDFLDGRNLPSLAERAEQCGIRLAGSHVAVAVAREVPFVDGGPQVRRVESAMRHRQRDILVTTKDGLLVCIAPEAPDVAQMFLDEVTLALGPDGSWRAGVGRPQRGPAGASRSFQQARHALQTGRRLQLPGPVHTASDLLVYQVLRRDSAALADLVNTVLDPLRGARSGPDVLLDTLSAYFAAGQVATTAARELHVGVRTVTYRLRRIKALTGYSVHDPRQRFTLQVAVLGARLLDWPSGPDLHNTRRGTGPI